MVGSIVDTKHGPATVTYVWPRLRSGDYLVTVELATPVKVAGGWLKQIDVAIREKRRRARIYD